MAFGDLKGTLTVAANSITNPTNATGSVSVAVGDLIFGVIGEQTNLTATTVTDNLGNSYTAQNSGAVGVTVSGRSYYSIATVAGTLTSISFAATASTDNVSCVCGVYTGPFKPSSVVDANPNNGTTDTSSPFTCPATGTLSYTGSAQEVIIAWAVSTGSAVWTATSPNLLDGQLASQAVLSTRLGHQVVTATTTVSPEFAGTNPTGIVLGTISFRSQAAVVTTDMWWEGVQNDRTKNRINRQAVAVTLDETRGALPPPPPPPSTMWMEALGNQKTRSAISKTAVDMIAQQAFIPAPAPAAAAVTTASASSSQVSINTWQVYDPTTGPVFVPPSAQALVDVQVDLRRTRSTIRVLDETSAPPPPAPNQFLPNFVQALDRPDQQPVRRKLSAFDNAELLPAPPAVVTLNFDARSDQYPVRKKIRPLDETSAPVGVAAGQFLPNLVSQWLGQSEPARLKTKGRLDETVQPLLPPAPVVATPVVLPDPTVFRRLRSTWMPLPTSCVFAIPIDDLWFEALDVPVRIKRKGRLDETVQPLLPPPPFVPPPTVLVDSTTQITARRNNGALARSTDSPVSVLPVVQVTFASATSSQVTINTWSVYDPTTGPVLPPAPVAPPTLVDARSDLLPTRQRIRPLAETSMPASPAPGQFLPNFVQALQRSDLIQLRRNPRPLDETTGPLPLAAAQTLIDVRSDLQPVRAKIRPLAETSAPVGVAAGQFLPSFFQSLQPSDLQPNRRKARPFDDAVSSIFPPAAVTQNLVDVRSDLLPTARRIRLLDETSAPIGVAAGQFIPNLLPQWGEQSTLWRVKVGAPAFSTSTADPIFVPAQAFTPTAQAFEQSTLQRRRPVIRQLDETTTPRPAAGQFLPSFVAQWGEPATIWRRRLGNPAAANATIDAVFVPPDPIAHRLQPSDMLPVRRRINPLAETSAVPPLAAAQFVPNFISQWGERPIPTKRRRGPRPFDPTDAPVSPAPAQFLPNFFQALQPSDSRPYVHRIRQLDETIFVLGAVVPHRFAYTAVSIVTGRTSKSKVSASSSASDVGASSSRSRII